VSIPNVSSVFGTHMLQVFQTCLNCFICVLLYVASVASRCFKSRSGCCTYCNCVTTICHKYFICFRYMLHRFYLDVVKVDIVFECYSWTHLPQPPVCSRWARMHACGSGGARAASTGNESGRRSRRGAPAWAHTCAGNRAAWASRACGRARWQAKRARASKR